MEFIGILIFLIVIISPLSAVFSLIVYWATKNEETKKVAMRVLNGSVIAFVIGFGSCVALLNS
ncbi:MAG: hypothetical protein CFE23_02680 [Flavobacterium sp. BFFFF1]|uniref:hypothetical protein n=1 Tax=unclassified Flavobacterium TaxID=196869 RepID=UPI000BC72904|nr:MULTISPECIES: hypothetical protein [unclassified Flavobacterium]OYU81805.1 MAG: hypothetical protein CFE23_02680 [Flavobacterium sp. BFFFF1]